jgi:ADP-ribose pyrophosphatase YjhB (NUDIX family)
MPFLTVCVVVMDEEKVLLTKRDDFHVWCLPSGGVEDGETVVDAAVRETIEETGLEVKITRLVGIYSRPADTPSGHAVVFTAIPMGEKLCVQSGETLETRYFPFNDLPTALSFGHRRRIEDAIQGVSSAVILQRPENPTSRIINRKELYLLRDQSGLTPEQFYMAYFRPDHVDEERLL